MSALLDTDFLMRTGGLRVAVDMLGEADARTGEAAAGGKALEGNEKGVRQ